MNKRPMVFDIGFRCPKCDEYMERRKHPDNWKPTHQNYFHKWDYCKKCKHVQHYKEFRNGYNQTL